MAARRGYGSRKPRKMKARRIHYVGGFRAQKGCFVLIDRAVDLYLEKGIRCVGLRLLLAYDGVKSGVMLVRNLDEKAQNYAVQTYKLVQEGKIAEAEMQVARWLKHYRGSGS